VPLDDDLDVTTFRIYLYLVRKEGSVGPRDVMRGADLSSPSVAHRHLQKLLDLGLVQKDKYGMYGIKVKANSKGHFWLGKKLLPRLIIYSLFFIGLLAAETIMLTVHVIAHEPISLSLALLTMTTGISAMLFLLEGIRLKDEMRRISLEPQ
jgi:hypothetical protein